MHVENERPLHICACAGQHLHLERCVFGWHKLVRHAVVKRGNAGQALKKVNIMRFHNPG